MAQKQEPAGAAVQVVVAILRDGELVLMGKRPADKKYPLMWEFPGGKVESGETLEQALHREIREELDVAISGAQRIRHDVNVYPDSGLFEVHYFTVESWSGTLRNQAFDSLAWIHPRDFKDYNILHGNKEICEQLAADADGGGTGDVT